MGTDTPWRAACNGAGKHPWFVCRRNGGRQEVHEAMNGRLVRFGSSEAAQRVADRLNATMVTVPGDAEPQGRSR